MNDIGPEIAREGLTAIMGYVGRNPSVKTHAEAAALLADRSAGFEGVPDSRWLEEARKHYVETPEGLRITYDPALRDSFLAAYDAPEAPDLWPLFDALAGKPVAVIRGANSDLLTPETVAEMARRRPDMIHAEVPGRAHIPFLDEPDSLTAIHAFMKAFAE
jgi:pimeloyl-ACP methyl ester carboxylesterase